MIQRSASWTLLFLVLAIWHPLLATAAKFDPAHVPADSKWVHHVDLEAMRSSRAGQWMQKKWGDHKKVADKIADVIDKTGVNLFEDVLDVTFYDHRFKKHHGVLTVKLTHVDTQKMLATLRKEHPDVRLSTYDGNRFYTWQKETRGGEPFYITGTVYDEKILIFSNNHVDVMNTIDVLAGKAAGLPESSPLAANPPEGTIWLARAVAMNGVDLPGNCPVLKQCDQLAIAAGQQGEDLFLNCHLLANSVDVATNAINVINGFRSLALLRFGSDECFARVMNQATAVSDDQHIKITWKCSDKDFIQVMKKVKEHCKDGCGKWGDGGPGSWYDWKNDKSGSDKKSKRRAWWKKYVRRTYKDHRQQKCQDCSKDKPCENCLKAGNCETCSDGETCPQCKPSQGDEQSANESSFANLPNIVDIGAQAEEFSTLAAAVQAADLVETLRGPGPFTVFAPTNEAFSKLPPGTLQSLLEPDNRQQLIDLLKLHVVSGRVLAADAVKLSKAPTLQGRSLPIQVLEDGVHLGNARILKTDIQGNNGVIHAIDSVLVLPPRETNANNILYDFQDNSADDSWRSINDNVMGGISEGGSEVSPEGTLVFSGNLSLENRGGFASIRSKSSELGLQNGDQLVVRVRGDGRQYFLNLHVPTKRMAFSYRASIDTEADQWQEITIPLSEFYGTSFGRRVSDAKLNPEEINSLGFLIADKQDGPFNLEIDWIKVE